MAPEKILDRIKKMMALRDDAAASQGEIENASAMIQKLLFQHNLSLNEVTQKQDVENYEKLVEKPRQLKREGKWINYLYSTIARWNFCSVVVTAGRQNPQDQAHVTYTVSIIGKPSDVEVVTYLCSWLIPKIREMASSAYESYQGIEKRGKFTRGYLMGCVSGINAKLQLERDRMQHETTAANSLVIRRSTELNHAIVKFFPRLNRARESRLSSQDGRAQGYEAGRNISLTKGITGETRPKRLLT